MQKIDYKEVEKGKVILLDKPLGLTPFDCVKILKQAKYENLKIGYAGRLDPMASGLMIMLLGDENKSKHKYENLSKQYIVEILLGVSTDSQDLLGIVKNSLSTPSIRLKKLKGVLESFLGVSNMQYPIYSAKRVLGKPLFYHARQGDMSKITIPTKEIHIYDLKINSIRTIDSETILHKIKNTVPDINGQFRQNEIMDAWKNFVVENRSKIFQIVNITVDSGAGAYMRWLAEEIGKTMSIPALAYSIHRTVVGKYKIGDIKSK